MSFIDRLNDILARLPEETQVRERQMLTRLQEAQIDGEAALYAALADATLDVDLRRFACWAAGRLGNKDAISYLLGNFDDPDEGIRAISVQSLGLLGDEETVEHLLRALNDPGDEVRTAAIHALGLSGSRRSVEPLIQIAVDSHESDNLRGNAIEALGNGGHKEAVDVLMELLDAPSAVVRFWSVYALGQIGDARALGALRRVAETDQTVVNPYGAISREAQDAIERINRRLV